MFKPHNELVEPENKMAKVWRYMDFTKFVSMLHSECLYFSRADHLGDPFEGSYPRPNVTARKTDVSEHGITPEGRPFHILDAMFRLGELSQLLPRYHAINCWHLNDHESAAMWKLYLKSNEGIAVQSNYRTLRDSIIDDETVYMGMVKYFDYEKESISAGTLSAPFFFKRKKEKKESINAGALSAPFFYKRKSFEHEREIRAVVAKWPLRRGGFDFTQETIEHGVGIKIDLSRLVKSIYIAPTAPDWFADLVKELIRKYGHRFEVVHSKLDEKPLF